MPGRFANQLPVEVLGTRHVGAADGKLSPIVPELPVFPRLGGLEIGRLGLGGM